MPKVIYTKRRSDYGMYEFRKTVNCDADKTLTAKVFAEQRYILYVNGSYVCEGPCRSSEDIRYFDTVGIDLKKGENIITLKVLHMYGYGENLYFSTVYKTENPTVIFEAEGENEKIESDGSWEIYYKPEHKPTYSVSVIGFTPPTEEITFPEKYEKCELLSGDDEYIIDEKKDCAPYGIHFARWLKNRPIPMIYPEKRKSLKVIKSGDGFIELDAGAYTTSKVYIDIEGAGDVKVTYSECYVFHDEKGNMVKKLRDDTTGSLEGIFDLIHANDEKCSFETYWFRAFRFIRIEGKDIEKRIKNIEYAFCHYPLDIKASFECSDESYNRIFDVSIRTLLCCMHEIYVDCPYYEQQQYVMDSAIECATTMRLSDDTRMVKKCLHDFAASQWANGLLAANYPCSYRQTIPGFSFFYIFLLKEYLEYTNDRKFARESLGTVDKILSYFDAKTQNSENGLVGHSEYWDFADWVDGWEHGVPPTEKDDVITLYNFYYAAALLTASDIAGICGRSGLSADYKERYEKLMSAINKYCFDAEERLYFDGIKAKTYSAHNIIWSILSGSDVINSGYNAGRLFDENVSTASFSMNYYLFRALEKCGRYDIAFDKVLCQWKIMLDRHCTTWCENPGDVRSECHAWSTAPVVEFSSNILGVKHSVDDVIEIKPIPGHLTYAKGTVPTRFGNVSVSWKKENGAFSVSVDSPEGVVKCVTMPDGKKISFTDKERELSCNI